MAGIDSFSLIIVLLNRAPVATINTRFKFPFSFLGICDRKLQLLNKHIRSRRQMLFVLDEKLTARNLNGCLGCRTHPQAIIPSASDCRPRKIAGKN